MKAQAIRKLWQEHIGECDACQSNTFKRCSLGDGLLAQLAAIEPMDGPRQVEEKQPLAAPVLLAKRIWKNKVQVFCPNCSCYHFHGWPDSSVPDEPQHRVAHCIDPERKGMFAKTGYYILLDRNEAAA